MNIKEIIAKRIAQELPKNGTVNLRIGLPTLVANYLPENSNLMMQSENGFLGLVAADQNNTDPNITNAGGALCGIKAGEMFF